MSKNQTQYKPLVFTQNPPYLLKSVVKSNNIKGTYEVVTSYFDNISHEGISKSDLKKGIELSNEDFHKFLIAHVHETIWEEIEQIYNQYFELNTKNNEFEKVIKFNNYQIVWIVFEKNLSNCLDTMTIEIFKKQLNIFREVEKINAMSHEELCKLWREAPSGHTYFDKTQPYHTYFHNRLFKHFGGFNSTISKKISM